MFAIFLPRHFGIFPKCSNFSRSFHGAFIDMGTRDISIFRGTLMFRFFKEVRSSRSGKSFFLQPSHSSSPLPDANSSKRHSSERRAPWHWLELPGNPRALKELRFLENRTARVLFSHKPPISNSMRNFCWALNDRFVLRGRRRFFFEPRLWDSSFFIF